MSQNGQAELKAIHVGTHTPIPTTCTYYGKIYVKILCQKSRKKYQLLAAKVYVSTTFSFSGSF